MKYLEQILQTWEKDSKIDNTSLDESSRQSPVLHAKYLPLLAEAKIALRRAHAEQKVLLKQKWLYYNGKMDHETLQELGWEVDPFNGLKVLKGELDYYYDSDPEIQTSEEKIQYFKTVIDTLTDIINNINFKQIFI